MLSYYDLTLTCKISAIWLVEKSIILAVFYSRPQCFTLWQKSQHLNALAGRNYINLKSINN